MWKTSQQRHPQGFIVLDLKTNSFSEFYSLDDLNTTETIKIYTVLMRELSPSIIRYLNKHLKSIRIIIE